MYNVCSMCIKTNRNCDVLCLKIMIFIPPLPEGGGGILFYLCPSVQDIFRRIFLENTGLSSETKVENTTWSSKTLTLVKS
jgi:hypothetical protein